LAPVTTCSHKGAWVGPLLGQRRGLGCCGVVCGSAFRTGSSLVPPGAAPAGPAGCEGRGSAGSWRSACRPGWVASQACWTRLAASANSSPSSSAASASATIASSSWSAGSAPGRSGRCPAAGARSRCIAVDAGLAVRGGADESVAATAGGAADWSAGSRRRWPRGLARIRRAGPSPSARARTSPDRPARCFAWYVSPLKGSRPM
jgi:hypothetical protein